MATKTEDRPLDWGLDPQMNPLEALMWRAEADPRLRSQMVALEILDEAPDWGRFVSAHDWGSRMVPRFRSRVVDAGAGHAPAWTVDPDFDLDYHVRRVVLPGDGSFSELLETTAKLAMRPFDKARSPWEAVLYEGLEGGKAAYALKMHHSATDGIGGVQLLGRLHSRRREPSPSKSQPPAPPPGSQSSTELIARSVLRDAAGVARGVTPTLRGLVSKRPDKTVTDAVRFGSSLRRVLGDSGAQPSPLLRGRSLTWRFLALDVAFADLRAAGKAVDASLNDAFLAALLGAFRRYHEQQGVPIDTMPVAIPISVRRKGDAAGGNRFAAGRLAGPVGIVNPAERMAAIRTQVRAARDEPALDGAALVAPVLSRLPGAVLAQLAGGMTKANDLQASNVPGIREDVYLAGAKIERAYPFGPLPGCAAMITLLTHGETACVGVNLDPAAITDVAGFGRCLVEGFNEVLALHPGAAPALLRS